MSNETNYSDPFSKGSAQANEKQSIFDDPNLKALSEFTYNKVWLSYEQIENNLFKSVSPESPGLISLEQDVNLDAFKRRQKAYKTQCIYRYDSTLNTERFPCFILDPFCEIWKLGVNNTRIRTGMSDFLSLADNTSFCGDYLLVNRETGQRLTLTTPYALCPNKTVTLNWTIVNLLRFMAEELGYTFLNHYVNNSPWGAIPKLSGYLNGYCQSYDKLSEESARMVKQAANPSVEKELKSKYSNLIDQLYQDNLSRIVRNENTRLMLALKDWLRSDKVKGRTLRLDFKEEGVILRSGIRTLEWDNAIKEAREYRKRIAKFGSTDTKEQKSKSTRK